MHDAKPTDAGRRRAPRPAARPGARTAGRQLAAAEQAVGDVVAEQQVHAAHRLQVQEAVEAGHALDDGRRQPDRAAASTGRGSQPSASCTSRSCTSAQRARSQAATDQGGTGSGIGLICRQMATAIAPCAWQA
jgi:hypothetical protein